MNRVRWTCKSRYNSVLSKKCFLFRGNSSVCCFVWSLIQVFRCVFMNEKFCITVRLAPNYVPFTVYPKKYAHGFCFAVLCCGYTLTNCPISIRLTSLHCGNLTIAPVPAKQPWWIWINTSCEFIMNDCITTTKQSTTKPCAYFLGYTVVQLTVGHHYFRRSLVRR